MLFEVVFDIVESFLNWHNIRAIRGEKSTSIPASLNISVTGMGGHGGWNSYPSLL